MIDLLLHLQSLVRALVTPRDVQFIRLSPNRSGRLYFYSKKKPGLFSVRSRGVSDSRVANQVFTNHDYRLVGELERLQTQIQQIQEDGKRPLIIDCGAHIGLASRYFAHEFPEAQVIGIEPNAESFALASQNCAELPNVELRLAAIGSRAGFAQIANPKSEPWATRLSRTEGETEIRVMTIAEILQSRPDCALAIVKIDIEGFESDLFQTNLDWIDDCPLIIIELHDWLFPAAQTSANFLKAISGRNRDFVYRGENVFSLRNRD